MLYLICKSPYFSNTFNKFFSRISLLFSSILMRFGVIIKPYRVGLQTDINLRLSVLRLINYNLVLFHLVIRQYQSAKVQLFLIYQIAIFFQYFLIMI